MKIKCRIKHCGKKVHVKIHQLCRGHYAQLLRKGIVINAPTQIKKKRELIIVDPA